MAGHTNRKYTSKFKQKVIEDFRQNNLSYKEISRKYELPDTVIAKWERIYLKGGLEGLYLNRRGHATQSANPLRRRKPKFDKISIKMQ